MPVKRVAHDGFASLADAAGIVGSAIVVSTRYKPK